MLLLSTAAFLVCSAVAGADLFRPLDVWLLGLAQGYTSGVMDVVGMVASMVAGRVRRGSRHRPRRRFVLPGTASSRVSASRDVRVDRPDRGRLQDVRAAGTGAGRCHARTRPFVAGHQHTVPIPQRPYAARGPPSRSSLRTLAEQARQARDHCVPPRLRRKQGLPGNPLAFRRTRRRPPRHRRSRMGIREQSNPQGTSGRRQADKLKCEERSKGAVHRDHVVGSVR